MPVSNGLWFITATFYFKDYQHVPFYPVVVFAAFHAVLLVLRGIDSSLLPHVWGSGVQFRTV